MKTVPDISIVIPTTGRNCFLEDALRSVDAQTLPVSQVILVCDGVNESGFQSIQQLAKNFPRVEVHHLETRQGAATARNKGLAHARGDFLVFLDDDDLLHPEMLENAITLFRRDSSVDVVVCAYQVMFTPSGAGDYPGLFPFNPGLMDQHPLNLVDSANFANKTELEEKPLSAFLRYLIPINSCVIKRGSVSDSRFPEDLVQGEDTYFWISLAHKGCKFRFSKKPYAFVRRHGGNTTRSKTGYVTEIPRCYIKIQSSGWLARREDRFLVALKLFYFAWKSHSSSAIALLARLLRYPDLMILESVKFFKVTLRDRRRLLKYYFQD